MILINNKLFQQMIDHAKETYPFECCGLLVGKYKNDKEKEILEVCGVENRNKDRANDRYEIDPGDFYRLDKEASSKGMDILGVYHSHPDHPDRPSDVDREIASATYSYIIFSVNNGEDVSAKSWMFEEISEPFEEEEIKVTA
ncbi:MAG: M67 family metallopeptidase [Thermodesulfobacteriota bacterium]